MVSKATEIVAHVEGIVAQGPIPHRYMHSKRNNLSVFVPKKLASVITAKK